MLGGETDEYRIGSGDVASQVVPPEKRFRVSLLLDAYGDLLTDKQHRFLRHYYEEDLSFGEIATEYGVSRQAIFDSVKHGEEALERFEQVLGLVGSGWARLVGGGLTPDVMIERLGELRGRFGSVGEGTDPAGALALLDAFIEELRGDEAEAKLSQPAEG